MLRSGPMAVLPSPVSQSGRSLEKRGPLPRARGFRLASDLIEPCVPMPAKRAPMGQDWVLRNRPTKKQTPCRTPAPPFVLRASPHERSA
jgi:hypothetical protein